MGPTDMVNGFTTTAGGESSHRWEWDRDRESTEGEARATWLWAFRNAHPDIKIVTPIFSLDERWHAFDADGDEIEAACLTGDNTGYMIFKAIMEDRYGPIELQTQPF